MPQIGQAAFTEAVVASAATTSIGSSLEMKIEITGTTPITSLGTGANLLRFIRFSGILTLTHNATTLILPGGANITTAAGDRCIAMSDPSNNWRVYNYTRADGKALIGPAVADITGTLPVAKGGTNYTGGAFTTTTPTPTASVGSFTSPTSVLGAFSIGKLTIVQFDVSIPTPNTGDTAIMFALPFSSLRAGSFFARNNNTGLRYNGRLSASSATAIIYVKDDQSAGAVVAGDYVGTIIYEAA